MLALVTNDDGIKAPGIQVLIEAARRRFDKVVVVAPRTQKSAVSQSITINKAFRVFERYGENAYGLEATPTDCVFFGIHELLEERPDFVLSGVNLGPNLGYDTIYSGTVAAAREGLLQEIPSIAFSLAVTKPVDFRQCLPHLDKVLETAMTKGLEPETMLNVNIPSIEMFGAPKGTKVCHLGRRVFANETATWTDPAGIKHGWIGGRDLSLQGDEGSDCYWMKRGYTTISALTWDLSCNARADMSHWETL
jgi:5'-nucleotidase